MHDLGQRRRKCYDVTDSLPFNYIEIMANSRLKVQKCGISNCSVQHICSSCSSTCENTIFRIARILYTHMALLCSVNFFVVTVRTVGLVVLYYAFSIGITFYQKWFIKNFHFPLTVVICHLVVKFILSAVVRAVWEIWSGQQRVILKWNVYIKQLAIAGIASALDIGFSNWSFEFITVSLYTMTKSTCIIFILGFSILFGLEKKRLSLVGVVFLISVGLFMFTYHSTEFNLQGFLLVLSASFLAGMRWTVAQLIMQRKDLGLSNPMDMIYHIQPWMILGLLPLAVAFEGLPIATSEKVFRFRDTDVLLSTCVRILIGATIAFLMEVSEYLLLTYTSSLTLSIAGILKEVCTLYLAVSYNGDKMTTLNILGLGVCLLGISMHVIIKALHSRAGTNKENDIKKWLLSNESKETEDAVFEFH
ncbi:solute carrier family 35 member C2-like isoform X2 [Limulus polyphemus]|uniref:Solute carrier family 35 member C2-like isoform X2 n=1 Tax=Limulus polyphemus TaxID=6850 RepID=A0ABM1T1K2_LIMPO|nr:solute carrier family 35 member C2-like isoform X2 [Limulus polyphemus]